MCGAPVKESAQVIILATIFVVLKIILTTLQIIVVVRQLTEHP